MKKNKTPKRKKKSLASQYFEVVKIPSPLSDNETLEQPHAYKFVDSITTYGAYEKPV